MWGGWVVREIWEIPSKSLCVSLLDQLRAGERGRGLPKQSIRKCDMEPGWKWGIGRG